jgi:hypothetical protein
MDNENYKCPNCGSNRVVSGKVALGDDGRGFEFLEIKKLGWLQYDPGNRGVDMRFDFFSSAKVCLDCGKGNASFTFSVDTKKAVKKLNKWGTDALKARLGTGDKSVSDETKV